MRRTLMVLLALTLVGCAGEKSIRQPAGSPASGTRAETTATGAAATAQVAARTAPPATRAAAQVLPGTGTAVPVPATTAASGSPTGDSASPGCTKGCVYLNHADGTGVAGVTICLSFATYPGGPVGITDAAGAYQAKVPSTQGHQETVHVWPRKAGYAFTPASIVFVTYGYGEGAVIDTNFVAERSSAASGSDECGSPPVAATVSP